MSDYLTLGSSQFTRMLDLVVAEQSSLRRHLFWYRLQKSASYLFGIALLATILAFVGALFWDEPEWEAFGLGLGPLDLGLFTVAGTFLMLVPLFFINLPFAWKLFKQERLRRRLGLNESLRERLRAACKKRKVIAALAVVGILAAVVAIAGIVQELRGHEHFPLAELIETFWLPLCIVAGGLSLPELWLMSRAVDRLEEVSRIRDRLQTETDASRSRSGRVEVPVKDYDVAARLEKAKVMVERERSVRRGIKLAKASIYAVQKSLGAQVMLETLDGDARLRAERAIFDLMSEPRPREAREQARGRLSLPVPDSSLILAYEVDDGNKRVRVHEVRTREAVR